MEEKQINIKDFVEYEWREMDNGALVKAYRNDNVGTVDVPTLIIGIGGTGVAAARTVKDKLEQRYNPKSTKKLEFLFIDTDSASVAGLKGSDTLVIQSADTAVLLREYRDKSGCSGSVLSSEITKWLDPSLSPFRVMNGAAGIRQAGRLILFLNISRVIRMLEQKLNKISVGYDLQLTRVKVHIFFGVGGGTGSGMFVDISYIIRELCKNCEIQGFVFMPDVSCMKKGLHDVHKRNIKRNGFAALKEIEQLMTLKPGENFIQSYADKTINVDSTYPIFDFCVLVGSKQNGRRALASEKEVYDHVAEYLLLELNQKEKNSFDFESFKSNLCADTGTNGCPQKVSTVAPNGSAVNAIVPANGQNGELAVDDVESAETDKTSVQEEKACSGNDLKSYKPFSRYVAVDADAKYLPSNNFYSWWIEEVFGRICRGLEAGPGIRRTDAISAEIKKHSNIYWKKHKSDIHFFGSKNHTKLVAYTLADSMRENAPNINTPPASLSAKLNLLGSHAKEFNSELDEAYHTRYLFRRRKLRFAKCYKQVVESDDGFRGKLNKIIEYSQDFTELMTEIHNKCKDYKNTMIDNSAFEFSERAFFDIRKKEKYTNSVDRAAEIIVDDFINDPDLWLGKKRTKRGSYLVEHVASIVVEAFEESGCASIGQLLAFSSKAGVSAIQDYFEDTVLNNLHASQLFPIKAGNIAQMLPDYSAVKILAHSNEHPIQRWAEEWEMKSTDLISDFPNQMHDRVAMGIYASGYSLACYDGMEDFENEYTKSQSAGVNLFANECKSWNRDFTVGCNNKQKDASTVTQDPQGEQLSQETQNADGGQSIQNAKKADPSRSNTKRQKETSDEQK